MPEKKKLLSQELRTKISKLIPIIISLFVILMFGLSFIGSFFQISHYEGEINVVQNVSFFDLLFTTNAGVSTQVYLIFIYILFPAFGSVLLLFSKYNKNFTIAAALLFLISSVASIVTKEVYQTAIKYFVRASTGNKYSYTIEATFFSHYIPVISYFVSFGLSLIHSSNETLFTPRDLSEMGILIAAAVGLNFVKFMSMPTGGSVNLQMLPLFILALRRGPIKGFVAGGIIYGLITCLTDGWGFACYPFDYMLGFGSIVVFGFFSHYILDNGHKHFVRSEVLLFIAGVLSTTLRFVGGTVSSMVVYGYDFIAAATYNAAYVFVSGGIALLIVMALLKPIMMINDLYPVGPKRELPEE